MIRKVISDDEYYKAYSKLSYGVQNSKSVINAVSFHYWEQGETRPKEAVIKIIGLDAKSYAEVENLKNANLYEENTVKIYYSYSSSKDLIIVMEYCKKGSIANQIENKKYSRSSWSESELRAAFISILKSLSNLHLHSFVHRDIKPSNIFLTSENILKIGDYGESKHKKSELNTIKGTEIYMSPYLIELYENCKKNYLAFNEQLIDPIKEDIWSLGKTFIEMALVNTYSFKKWSTEEISSKVRVELVNRKYSERFIELLLEMIGDTRQSKRTAQDFLNDFRILDGQSIGPPDLRTGSGGGVNGKVFGDQSNQKKCKIDSIITQEKTKTNKGVKVENSIETEEIKIQSQAEIAHLEKLPASSTYHGLSSSRREANNNKCGRCSQPNASVQLSCKHFYHVECINIVISDQLLTAKTYSDVYCVCCSYPISIRHFKNYPCFTENPQAYNLLMNSRAQIRK